MKLQMWCPEPSSAGSFSGGSAEAPLLCPAGAWEGMAWPCRERVRTRAGRASTSCPDSPFSHASRKSYLPSKLLFSVSCSPLTTIAVLWSPLSTDTVHRGHRAAVRRGAVSQGLAPPRGGLPPSQTSPQHSTGFSSRSWMPLRPSLQAPCHLPAPTCEGLLLLFRLLFGPLIPVTSVTTSLPTTAESLSSSSPLSLSISRELRGCPRGGPHVSHSQHGQAGLIISPQMLLFLPR